MQMQSKQMDMPLLTPFKIGGKTAKNRFVLAPMTRQRFEDESGTPTSLVEAYYLQRAEAGLLITEATNISATAKGFSHTPNMYTPAHADAWRSFTDSVHETGSLIAMQLAHAGRLSNQRVLPAHQHPHAPSTMDVNYFSRMKNAENVMEQVLCSPAVEMSIEAIKTVHADFCHAATLALDAGFDFIELHAAHGFLIHQFLSASSNKRNDLYGGEIENRSLFLLELLAELAKHVPLNKVGIRISPVGKYNGVDDTEDEALYRYLVKCLAKLDLAYLHVSEPNWNGSQPMSEALRTHITSTFTGCKIFSGGYQFQTAEERVKSNTVDAIAFGRSFIANPKLVKHYAENLPLHEVRKEFLYDGAQIGYTDY
ncbi:alkene reductase [Leeia sp. TBRC 13508]|uniref:Alkene reductase n=1 Tax=Leeia speluncae TaxID=2884804 RepID=A0ABS8D934_9NEIS|nr:alkene reductase [Leeia speluncae]MCB6184690.1 alkene reductase [Leeia speluncae]